MSPTPLPRRDGPLPRTTASNPHTYVPPEAFIVAGEFARMHPAPDHSLHAMLPLALAAAAIEAGWAETHPVARLGLIPETAVMLCAPRDSAARDVVDSLVRASHAFARPA